MSRAVWYCTVLGAVLIGLGGCDKVKDALTYYDIQLSGLGECEDTFIYYDDAFTIRVLAKNVEPQVCESGIDYEGIPWTECEGPWYTLAIIDADKAESIIEVRKNIYMGISRGQELWVKIRKWGKDGKWQIHSFHLTDPRTQNSRN